MNSNDRNVALLAELAAVLARHPEQRCAPAIEHDRERDETRLTVTFHQQETVAGDLETVEMVQELQYLVDMAQLRALASKYDIDAKRLEALLPGAGA
jgi:hypothetical protein